MSTKLVKVWLDRQGVRKILRAPEVRALVANAANDVRRAVDAAIPADQRTFGDGETVRVSVTHSTTDRAVARVVVEHPKARGLQSKYGVFTYGVRAAGLTMRRKKRK